MRYLALVYTLACVSLWIALRQDTLEASKERGRLVYSDFCVTCHQDNGEGVEGIYPPLAGSDYLMAKREASIRGIKYGQRGPLEVNGITYDNVMIPMGLSDREVADVMNYIRNNWGNRSTEEMVRESEVSGIGPR